MRGVHRYPRSAAGRTLLSDQHQPIPYNGEWKSLLAAMEGTLRLHHHQSGALERDAKYLHQRTGGLIGSLAHLIRSAAIRSVLNESEHITRELLDTVLIDYAAHTSARRAAS